MTASLLSNLGSITGDLTLGIGSLISLGVKVPLSYWSCMSNLSSDRAGLLACQDLDVALSVMLSQAGAPMPRWGQNLNEWKAQIREVEDYDCDTLTRYYKRWTRLNPLDERSQQFPVLRARELIHWHASGGYDAVLSRQTRTPLLACHPPIMHPVCTACGSALEMSAAYCPHYGRQVMLPVRYCQECGRSTGWNQQYCPGCGATFG